MKTKKPSLPAAVNPITDAIRPICDALTCVTSWRVGENGGWVCPDHVFFEAWKRHEMLRLWLQFNGKAELEREVESRLRDIFNRSKVWFDVRALQRLCDQTREYLEQLAALFRSNPVQSAEKEPSVPVRRSWLPHVYDMKDLKPRHPVYRNRSADYFRKAISDGKVDGIRRAPGTIGYHVRADVRDALGLP